MTTPAGTDGPGAGRRLPEGNGTVNDRWPGHRAAHPGGETPYDHRDRRDGSRRGGTSHGGGSGGTSHGEGKRDA